MRTDGHTFHPIMHSFGAGNGCNVFTPVVYGTHHTQLFVTASQRTVGQDTNNLQNVLNMSVIALLILPLQGKNRRYSYDFRLTDFIFCLDMLMKQNFQIRSSLFELKTFRTQSKTVVFGTLRLV